MFYRQLKLSGLVLLFAAAISVLASCERPAPSNQDTETIVINEALRTLLYLPIYHAIEDGHFEDEGISVDLVTGGTATNAFSAMLSGEADFAIADPMYVPISREQGADTKVVGQIVARIAVWALSNDPDVSTFDLESIEGSVISTHPRPMTAYTYANARLREIGLEDGNGVEILQNRPGTETAPFFAGSSNFVVTLEPGTSIAQHQGAHVVYSWPEVLGDRIFTGIMTRQDLIDNRHDTVLATLRAINTAVEDLRNHPEEALATAKVYFSQVDEAILQIAISRLLEESVIPESIFITEESWNSAVSVRLEAGDLHQEPNFAENVPLNLIRQAISSE